MNNVINFAGGGVGDMQKSVYDPSNSGVVVKAVADDDGRNIKSTYQEQTQNLTASENISDTDVLPFYSDTELHKKTTWSNIKSKLKGYLDNIYALASHTHSKSDVEGLTEALSKTPSLTATDDGSGNITITLSNG